jgi:hypothetical protein
MYAIEESCVSDANPMRVGYNLKKVSRERENPAAALKTLAIDGEIS